MTGPIMKHPFELQHNDGNMPTQRLALAHDQLMTIHQFSRRAFLRGIGVTMALPWMESLTVWGDTPPAPLTSPRKEPW